MTRVSRFAAVFAPLALMGCYTQQPIRVGAAPVVGSELVLELNDAGRVALGAQLGPAIHRIEGRLLQQDEAGYVVAVTQLDLLHGGVQLWSNESVRVGAESVRTILERRFSRARTIALGAVGVGGLAYAMSRGLLGFGSSDPDPVPPDLGASLRILWP